MKIKLLFFISCFFICLPNTAIENRRKKVLIISGALLGSVLMMFCVKIYNEMCEITRTSEVLKKYYPLKVYLLSGFDIKRPPLDEMIEEEKRLKKIINERKDKKRSIINESKIIECFLENYYTLIPNIPIMEKELRSNLACLKKQRERFNVGKKKLEEIMATMKNRIGEMREEEKEAERINEEKITYFIEKIGRNRKNDFFQRIKKGYKDSLPKPPTTHKVTYLYDISIKQQPKQPSTMEQIIKNEQKNYSVYDESTKQ